MKRILFVAVFLLLLAAMYWLWTGNTVSSGDGTAPIANVTYQCQEKKSIKAVFYKGKSETQVTAGSPPKPGGHVDLTLSDGRTMSLQQTISADGARYSDGDPSIQGDEKFVFWSKGEEALVLENNTDQTYVGCVEITTGF